MANTKETWRVITATTDLSPVIRYVRHVSLAESGGTPAAAVVQLRDGSGGATVMVIKLAASESKHISFPTPLFFPNGLYVGVASGTVAGCIDGV